VSIYIFLAALLVCLLLCFLVWRLVASSWSSQTPSDGSVKDIELHADAFRQPFATLVTLCGFLIPLSGAAIVLGNVDLAGGAAALSSAGAIAVLVALAFSAWGLADMATKTGPENTVTFHLKNGETYWAPATQLSVASTAALVGLVLLAGAGASAAAAQRPTDPSHTVAGLAIAKALPAFGSERDPALAALGTPDFRCGPDTFGFLLAPAGVLIVTVDSHTVTRILIVDQPPSDCLPR